VALDFLVSQGKREGQAKNFWRCLYFLHYCTNKNCWQT